MPPKQSQRRIRTLAVDPTSRGFGFAVLEGKDLLIDWGVVQVWSKNKKELVARIDAYIDRYRPVFFVTERVGSAKARKRSREITTLLAGHAAGRHLIVVTVSREAVRRLFHTSGTTKFEIALAITKTFPELASRMPRKRKPWMSEDERMNLFDALAFALTALWSPTQDLESDAA
jgi:Holliday junction resolvasome RuvABC endonuclease subunit